MSKKIFIILPFKESLKVNSAGAVSIFVQDTTKYSKYEKNIKIISSDDNDKRKLFRNRNYILDFCKKYKYTNIDIIEIHNRPEYLIYIKKFFPKTKIKLCFHNDPLSLRGSENIEDREFIINNTNKIVFISRWIQKRFYNGIKNVDISSSAILPHGIDKKKNIDLNKKEKNILFVGKLNRSKGYHIFCEVAYKFKKYDPSWKFLAIGDESRKEIFPSNDTVKELGYLDNSKVLKYFEKSEIAIGNSVWDEPLGRIAIEASSRKCLPIISNKAGFSESKRIAHVLKDNTSTEILKYLKKVTKNKVYRRKKQNTFYNNHNFDLKNSSKKLDEIRHTLLNNFDNFTNSNKNIKILHVANFNENSDGRLYYSFANKINNGFIKNDHIVEKISDRFFLKANKNIVNPFNNNKKLNDKIINTLKNFSPNILLIGHVFNIEKRVFFYCNENNIKICSWYIDSVSSEFLNSSKKKDFFYNLEYVDKCFITSSPKIFKSNKFFHKFQFIPNPVDDSIDNYRNFENKDLEFDIFCAISHGQNRGLLKKGKSDERDKLIENLAYELPEIKFASFGIDNFEPIWGVNYFYYLSESKMALNISRGTYQDLYSSDRISSLIGNGLLVFINENTKLNKLFTNKEVIFYRNVNDLINKIKFYASNDKLRKKYAKSAYVKYHKYMNNKLISNYILNCVGLTKTKKPFWHNKI
jgi:glycosyltransferase involved in cell wall biosynthesis